MISKLYLKIISINIILFFKTNCSKFRNKNEKIELNQNNQIIIEIKNNNVLESQIFNNTKLENITKFPITFALDIDFVFPTIVSMTSICDNSDKSTFIEFFLLVPQKFPKKSAMKIYTIKKKYKNCKISFIRIGNLYDKLKITSNKITTPTFYRISIPILFPNYNKMIYLDGDTITLGDLKEFYNLKMKGNYILGHPFFNPKVQITYHKLKNKVFINAGVLLMDLKNLRNMNFTKKCIEVLEFYNNHGIKLDDQEALNIVTNRYIGYLPPKIGIYGKSRFSNVLSWFINNIDFMYPYTQKEYLEAYCRPLIVHYANTLKPWKKNYPGQYLHEFYYYASKTEFLKEIFEGYFYVHKENIKKTKNYQNASIFI